MAWNGSNGTTPVVTPKRSFPRKRVWALVSAGIVVVVLGGVMLWPEDGVRKQLVAQESPSLRLIENRTLASLLPQEAVREALKDKKIDQQRSRRKDHSREDYSDTLKGEDLRLAEKIQDALDEDDQQAVVELARKALRQDNQEVRQSAVEALGWFGAATLPDLTAFLTDKDEDVRATTLNLWEQAVQEIEKADDRFDLVAAALATVSDEDQLTSMSDLLTAAAGEVLDDEKDAKAARAKRLKVVQTLADIIRGGAPQNATAAKSAYSDITGNEWRGISEAQRYLDDPENYTVPDDE